MKTQFDLSQLDWKISGWSPNLWRTQPALEIGTSAWADVRSIPGRVPGSVQSALLEAGLIPDWNIGLNARKCEWVENRHWIYEAAIPDDWLAHGRIFRLRCLGLDYSGWVVANGREVGAFKGSFVPHVFDLAPHLQPADNVLRIVFECPPRWLGYCGATSQFTDWKPRFNFTWDWTPRVVQIGVWDSMFLETSDGPGIEGFECTSEVDPETRRGSVMMRATACGGSTVAISMEREGVTAYAERVHPSQLTAGVTCRNLRVDLWWPNMQGEQPLYTLCCRLLDAEGGEIDSVSRRIGFRSLAWDRCEGAPECADPWICVVNGKPTFLQGVNWTPIRPNFADVTDADYRKRLEAYRDLGVNILRVWGGAFLEKQCFYDLCDELGLLVWQEFPLSSSWIENWPPENEKSIEEMAAIAESYIVRRRHHVSLALWCAGNELQGSLDGSKTGRGKPTDASHPLLRRLGEVVAEHDPGHRFLPASASGPREYGDEEFGLGLHWDVHGPWNSEGSGLIRWMDYWRHDDSLFRSEVGHPGASPVEVIRRYLGDCAEMPASEDNPFWTRPCPGWVQWRRFVEEHEREPRGLEELVTWSQLLQSEALATAARSCKSRFPRCGGIIVWMGHDSFPCASNTSILDFDGNPKPAAMALRGAFRDKQQDS